MITSTQIINTEIFALVGVLVFKLFSRKVLFKTEKTVEMLKNGLLLEKLANFTGKLLHSCK